MRRRLRGLLAALSAALLSVGCTLALGPRGPEPFHLDSVSQHGDPSRRASTRLVLEGLSEDVELRPAAALVLYERALQVDPTNPWAYLALARHRAHGPSPTQALSALDQAESLLRGYGELTPGVEAHLVGLRGAALVAEGDRGEGLALLRRAREIAPDAWGDARLDPEELR
jgi:tetratricopeptide (TPR) repeat protein